MEEHTVEGHNNTESTSVKAKKGIGFRLMLGIALLSFGFGGVGGMVGAFFLLQNPFTIGKYSNLGLVDHRTVVLNEESAVVDVVKKSSPAVVSIVITKDLNLNPGNSFDNFFPFFWGGSRGSGAPNIQEVGAGSGFLITSDGLIVTNKHVVSDEAASYTVVLNDGKSFKASVLARDPVNDLAIIKIDIKDAPTLSLADSSQLQLGQRVVAIGNSLGEYQNTITTGVISGMGRSVLAGGSGGTEQLEGVVQTDAAINPGNSGGPLLNMAGQVIGVNTAVDRQGQLVGFAIPSNDVQQVVSSFQRTGKIIRPFLGVRYVMLNKTLAEQENLPRDYGALLVRGQTQTDFAVLPGSPADKAGLRENDIILAINGKSLGENLTLVAALRAVNVGDTVKLRVYQRGVEKDINVLVEEYK